MASPRDLNIDRVLRTNASSPNYTQTLDSYLYGKGINQQPNKVKFFVELVNESGQIVPYVIDRRESNAGSSNPSIVNQDVIQGVILTVNPSTVSVNLSKIVNRTQSMVGWIEDHWGEELDTITFQGSTAAFIYDTALPGSSAGYRQMTVQSPEQIQEYFNNYMDIPDMASSEPRNVGDFTGLAARRRRETVSYQEWKKVISIMNGNGANFDSWGFVTQRLFVQLSYDYAMYRGYFESIDTTEDSESPFKFTYTATFKSEKTVYSFLK
jgi:hypothetical protein